MSITIQTPTGVYGAKVDSRFHRMYNNQFFDYLSEQLPRNHKDMFKWCEVVWANSPVVVNAIKKLVNYPVTDFIYKTDSKKIREETRLFLEEHLDMKAHLVNLGLDYYIYGNVFRSVYFPFTRFLVCQSCGTEINAKEASYRMKKGEFILKCGNCKTERVSTIRDDLSQDISKIRLVSWDPKNVELSTNPITADTAYYYKPPASIVQGIMRGDGTIVNTVPEVFLRAFKVNKAIQLSNNFYHIKHGAISGLATGWGISPLVPTLKLYLYTSILRKSVEAIGLEHITPQRILFPQGNGNDPTMMSSMGQWKDQVTKALNAWRMDPNYVMLAPYPTGIVNLGSQGRGLMPTAELKAAEEDMIRALDIPVEFVFGSTNLNNSPIALRMLENQLQPYVSQLKKYVNWVIDTVNAQYDKDYCHVDFTPFTLSDDMMRQQMLMQIMGNGVSKTTVQEALRLNPDEERDKLKEEAIEDMKSQKELEFEQQEIQRNITNQAIEEQRAEEMGQMPNYDQQKLMAAAQNLVAQMLSVPYEERRSYLAQLKGEDFVMYSMVTTLLDSANNRKQRGGPEGGGMPPGAQGMMPGGNQ